MSRCGLGNGLVFEKVILIEYDGGSVAGKVIPGPVVCLLRSGGFVEVKVGDVTVDVVNLPVVVTEVVVDVIVVVVVIVTVVNNGDGGIMSETLDVGKDLSIFSELEFSEDDGLDAFDVFDELLSAFSICVLNISFLLSMFRLSLFFPEK